MQKNVVQNMIQGATMGGCAGLVIFISEFLLTQFHAEISFATYGFFLILYLLTGLFGGVIFAWILTALGARLQAFSDKKSILHAGFLATVFFLYGFYYLNEKLTPGVGIFAPISLAASGIHVCFSALIFFMVLRTRTTPATYILSFVGTIFLPIAALVGMNFRFFLWHAPHTDTAELFMAAIGFGAVGLAATWISLKIAIPSSKSPNRVRPAISAGLGLVCVIGFSISGRPSGASYQVNAPKPPGRVEAAHKNVIWIVMDTARRDQISIYGDEGTLTPNIDAFAKDALVMEKAISSAPWTIPSHASMFTGMFPSKHAAHRGVPGGKFTNPLAGEHMTIAEILQSYGYDTAAVAGNVAGLSRSFGFSQGFNYYFDGRPVAFSLFWGKALMAVSKGIRARLLKVNEICLSSELNGLVFDWLKGQSKEQPFFLFVNYMEPHDGIEHIPEPYNSMYDYDQSEYDRLFEDFDQGKVVRFEQEVSAEQMRMIAKVVARRVSFMDHNIGRLLQQLKERGLYEDSYIVVTSDHGELNGEHFSFGHNTDLYNELIWVPMIVKYPGSARKGRSAATVQNIDIMPELLSHLKMDIPAGVQGQPFEQVSHEIVAELFEQKKAQALLYPERYYRDLRAIFTNVDGDTLKYIWSSNGDDEIFNLSDDPKELKNLVSQKSEVAAKLDKHLKSWLKSFDPIKFGNGQTQYTKEVEDRLRSLGYIK